MTATEMTTSVEELAEDRARKEDLTTKRQALAELIAPVRWLLLVGRILGAISGIMAVVPYIALVQLGGLLLEAQAAGVAPDAARVTNILILLVGTFLGRIGIYFVALLLTHLADVKLNQSIRERMMAAIGQAPLSWFSERTSGQVRKSLQDDVTALHVMVAHKPVDYMVAVFMPLALLVYAFIIDWRLGLLAISLLLFFIGFYAYMMKDMGHMTVKFDRRLENLAGTMVEFISGINVVKAFGTVGKAHHRYLQQAAEISDFYAEWVKPMLTGSALAMAIISAPMMLLVNFGGGAWLASAGYVTPTQVVATSLIALMLPHAMEVIGDQTWGQQLAEAAAVRLKDVIDCERLESPAESRQTPNGHAVTLTDVSFSYGEVRALRRVSLELPEGSVTALVGPSGSGKSTLATMVARFHDPDEGKVLIGGVDIKDLSEEDLYSRVAFVLQDPQLLHLSVAGNIALARPEASMADIEAAAKAAQIHDEIQALPRGYDTVLGSETKLSGGQEQRIAIARAILADRPILLLDEATAMTDPDCESAIQAALSNLVVGKTVLVIAHRPASVKGADQIVVLVDGEIAAKGTHEELIDQPHYRSIWRASSATTKPEGTKL